MDASMNMSSCELFKICFPKANCAAMSNAELATGYAALILADEGLDITADKLSSLTKAAGVEVEPIWTQLFAKALEGKDVKDMLLNVGGTTTCPTPSCYLNLLIWW
jgi:60s Acidic ribosomal protein